MLLLLLLLHQDSRSSRIDQNRNDRFSELETPDMKATYCSLLFPDQNVTSSRHVRAKIQRLALQASCFVDCNVNNNNEKLAVDFPRTSVFNFVI
jgi:hypothetical protein